MTRARLGRPSRLIRHLPMKVLDVSRSGCLVETVTDLRVGTTGVLEVELWGVQCRYPVRVTRVAGPHLGDGGRRVAAEFVWGGSRTAPEWLDTRTEGPGAPERPVSSEVSPTPTGPDSDD